MKVCIFHFPFILTRLLIILPQKLQIGYATASVEGRIAVEYFDPSPASQEKKYAFKCHRQTINDVDHVWPVNSLAFHPSYNTFASAGSDATVSIWDHKVKKRLRQYPKFRGGVAAVAFNCDGSRLAVGVSCTWDEGEAGFKANPVRPWLGVRKVGDEVKVWGLFVLILTCHFCFASYTDSPFVLAKTVGKLITFMPYYPSLFLVKSKKKSFSFGDDFRLKKSSKDPCSM